jgi:hypothetical protein
VSGGLIELQRELTDPAFLGLDQSPRVMRDQLDLRRGSRSMLAPEQLRPECAPTVEATRRQAACTPPSSSTSATMPTCSSQRDHDRSTSPLQVCSICRVIQSGIAGLVCCLRSVAYLMSSAPPDSTGTRLQDLVRRVRSPQQTRRPAWTTEMLANYWAPAGQP